MSSTPASTLDRTRPDSHLHDEIARLERDLSAAKAKLASPQSSTTPPPPPAAQTPSYIHALLLLSDSSLPLGSFAYSSGLESYLAHHPRTSTSPSPITQLTHFLELSLHSIANAVVPYIIAGYKQPQDLEELDNDLDASTLCTVARRASVKQGGALAGVWERSFRGQYSVHHNPSGDSDDDGQHNGSHASKAMIALNDFSALLKSSSSSGNANTIFTPNGHLPPLFGCLCAAFSIPLSQTLYIFLFNHAKTIVSAAIRAGVLGPYQAQGLLAGEGLRARISGIVGEVDWEGENEGAVEDGCESEEAEEGGRKDSAVALAGQSVPMLDLWGGRHEIIYSRIFNS